VVRASRVLIVAMGSSGGGLLVRVVVMGGGSSGGLSVGVPVIGSRSGRLRTVSGNEWSGTLDIGVSQEGCVLNADVVVHVEEIGSVRAWDGFLGERAGERKLIENSLVSAEE